MNVETRLLHPTLACEVIGLHLWEPLDEATVAQLRALWARHGVMVFRRQALSEHELAVFNGLLGPLERTVRSDWASPIVPEISLISNLKDGLGRPIGGLGDGELQWHSDQSYMLHAATGAALYALELPGAGQGGRTYWVDLRAAYAGLADRLKRAVDGRRGIFDYTKRLAGYNNVDRNISDDAKRRTPPVTHSLVHVHPVTGDKALYLDTTTLVGIEGMDEAAGAALVADVSEAATQPEYVYAHDWQVGDLLVWDNGFTMHRRDPLDPSSRRLMKRLTMVLDPARHIVPDGALARSPATA